MMVYHKGYHIAGESHIVTLLELKTQVARLFILLILNSEGDSPAVPRRYDIEIGKGVTFGLEIDTY